MTRAGSSILVDTNVLLAATSQSRRLHRLAFEVLEQWPRGGIQLLTSGQILREYLVVATRPLEANGLGISLERALKNVRSLGMRMRLLPETEVTAEELKRILSEVECVGKQIHDANLVATLISNGSSRILTANPKDFVRFRSLIEVVDLASLGPP